MNSNGSDVIQPDWLAGVINNATRSGAGFVMRDGILRAEALLSQSQANTQRSFASLWEDRGRFTSEASLAVLRDWYRENYGDVANAPWWEDYGERPLVLEAGCGAGISGSQTFGKRISKVRYLAVDISSAVEHAAERFASAGLTAAFMQADLMQLPLLPRSVDVIYSQGVLHHTDSTREALLRLAKLLKPGGRFLFYVYRKKGPVREYTDDLIRERLKTMEVEEQWKEMRALTRLGIALGEVAEEIAIPEDISLLEIPVGRFDVQRLFYWHVAKAFYRSDFTLDEMTHINFDWYAPENCHRQTLDQVRAWCSEASLEIEREHLQESGISVVARCVA